MTNNIAVVRGGGDIGTGVAHMLYRSGFDIIVLETDIPTVIRRKVAFAQAIFDGETVVEHVKAVKANTFEEISRLWQEGKVAVVVDPSCDTLQKVKADVLVDAVLAKRNTGMHRDLAPITIALGPGFKAGKDVDVVIETRRGHNLGRLIFEGYAEPDTGIPEAVEGYKEERVIRSPCDGKITHVLDIGDEVKKGVTVCRVGQEEVPAPIDGVIRGVIMSNLYVKKGCKIGDVDPRGIEEYCFTISDKARAMGGSVLAAVLYLKNHQLRTF
jgi:xanthine dehydrogenase accessory factor